MRKTVETFIREHKMLAPGDRVIAAVSGGADSLCLLYLLTEMKESLGVQLRVVHVHHGLRGNEADRDAEFVERTAKELKVPCVVVHKNVAEYANQQRMSVEEAARELRYQVLRKEADRWDGAKIAVAHHREDQAETILHNLFRGSGLKGLCGMAAVKGTVIRPLLCVGRAEILGYLQEKGISHCEDSTNESMDYTRNRIRHQLIPEICREINTGAVEHIVSAGNILRQAEEYFERKAGEIWHRWGIEEEQRCGIEAEVLKSQPEVLKGYVVRKMIYLVTGSMKDITFAHIEEACKLMEKETGKRLSLPYRAEAWMEYGIMWISAVNIFKGDNKLEELQIEKSAEELVKSLRLSHFPYKKYQKIPENQYTKWFDYDRIEGMLSVRTRQRGDYITLKDGKHKTVKAYMIDEKVPRQERDRILLLAEGHHILWIVGYRISEYYKITEQTQKILQVQVDGGEGYGR